MVIRGRIAISGVSADCNMHRQKIETLPKTAAEHSAMLGFAGAAVVTIPPDLARALDRVAEALAATGAGDPPRRWPSGRIPPA
ncbi:MAG: hypothetical protein LC808_02810 [Actinobacteria bacterium]|nr:hypothetical protein [Actinomycetota bacterium]